MGEWRLLLNVSRLLVETVTPVTAVTECWIPARPTTLRAVFLEAVVRFEVFLGLEIGTGTDDCLYGTVAVVLGTEHW
jgi:hypothetical protein